MKHCPKCNRNYADPTLNFCLDDGEWLREVHAADEPATAVLNSEAPTLAHIPTTEAPASSNKKSFIAGVLGLLFVTVLGVGGYWFYGGPAVKKIDSIAVIPFVNESGNSEFEYLSDGMTDTLISSLSELPDLKVKARTSVFRYKGKEIDPRTIGDELGVQAIVTGRVAQRGGRTSVSLEVVDTQSEDVIFSTKYDKPQSELVTLQSDIARDVSGKLKSKLSRAETARVTKAYTVDPEAYQLYLNGLFHWHKRGRDNLLQATTFFNKAIERDPGYALAHSSLALTYGLYPLWYIETPEASFPRSKAAALRALELDESLAEAHTALGFYYCYWERDYAQAEKEYRRAIELKPNYAPAHQHFAYDLLVNLKRFDEAISESRLAHELDPLSPIIATNLGNVLFSARHYDEAIAAHQRALAIDPNFFFAHSSLGDVLAAQGRYPEAISAMRKAVELDARDPLAKGILAYGLARTGQRDEALKIAEELKKQGVQEYVPGFVISLPYIALGNRDEALAWLEKEVDDHGTDGLYLAVDPKFDELRSDPEFKALLKRMNLPE